MRNGQVVMAACGGGVNSTALLVGLRERGLISDAVLFADTGGEKPETYEHIGIVADWMKANGFPELVTVRNTQSGTLESLCLAKGMMPSVAYGKHRRGCSDKHKQRPQHKWARQWPVALAAWKRGERVVKLIGYGADERHRARIQEDRWYEYDYPLIEWGWDRAACEETIRRAGLPVPPKSACFFCPSSKKPEILELKIRHPDLLARAIEIERAAKANLQGKSIKGLGAYFSWEEYIAKVAPVPDEPEVAEDNPFGCMCVSPTPDDEYEDGDD